MKRVSLESATGVLQEANDVSRTRGYEDGIYAHPAVCFDARRHAELNVSYDAPGESFGNLLNLFRNVAEPYPHEYTDSAARIQIRSISLSRSFVTPLIITLQALQVVI